MKERTKDFIWWSGIVLASALIISSKVDASEIQDHYKNVIQKKPYSVEVCYEQQTSGDKTGDAIKGAIIGGILGNNVGNIENGGAAGAIIGGLLGHQNSTASGGTQRVCQMETRYTEERKTIYSHSTINFVYEGKQYSLKFQK